MSPPLSPSPENFNHTPCLSLKSGFFPLVYRFVNLTLKDKHSTKTFWGHISLRATEVSQSCCKGIQARPDVFRDLNITFKYFLCLKKKTVNSNVLFSNLKLFRTKADVKSVIRDYLLRNYVVYV